MTLFNEHGFRARFLRRFFSSPSQTCSYGRELIMTRPCADPLTHSCGRRPRRSGIILLVVLGMLTLFSVLGVSYLVFTSRQRTAAFNINRAETAATDPDPWLDESIKQVLVGSNGPESSLWGHDVLGDLYGMRDAVVGQLTAPPNYVVSSDLVAPEVLLDSFVRVPTQLYTTALHRVRQPKGRS